MLLFFGVCLFFGTKNTVPQIVLEEKKRRQGLLLLSVMVLSALPPEFWLYGFAGTVATQSYWIGIVLSYAIWLSSTWYYHHRTEPSPLDVYVHMAMPGMAFLGALVGIVFVWFFQTPRFFNVQAWDSRGKAFPWFILLSGFTLLLVSGIYALVDGDTTVGVPLTAVFGTLTLVMIMIYIFAKKLIPDGSAQLKYIALFSMVCVVPAANDYMIGGGNRAWNILVWFGAWFVAMVIFLLAVRLRAINSTAEKSWWDLSHSSQAWRVLKSDRVVTVLSFFAAIFLVYFPALVVDQVLFSEHGYPASSDIEAEKIDASLIAVSVSSGFIMVMIGLWYFFNKGHGLHVWDHFGSGASDLAWIDELESSKRKKYEAKTHGKHSGALRHSSGHKHSRMKGSDEESPVWRQSK